MNAKPAKVEKLKLRAETADDLTVISSLLQDAVCQAGEMAYLPEKRRFALVVNRYCWECEAVEGRRKDNAPLRVRTALRFENVLTASARSIPFNNRKEVLELLAIESARKKGGWRVTLYFAGDAAVRLGAEVIDAYLEDMTGPWPARIKPKHPVA